MEPESWRHPKKRIQPPWEPSRLDFAATSSTGSFFDPPPRSDYNHLRNPSDVARSNANNELDPWRRQSLSGPLDRSREQLLHGQMRRLSLSGPLPCTNPYLSSPAMPQEDDLPPLTTLPPWSEFRQSGQMQMPEDCNGFGLRLSSSSPDNHSEQQQIPDLAAVLLPSPSASMQLIPASPQATSSRSAARKAKLPASPSMARRQNASNGHLSRSLSFDATNPHKRQQERGVLVPVVQQLTKARSLADGVVESLVKQLMGVSEGSNLLTDTIFSPSTTHVDGAGDSRSSARDTVERILLVQLHALTPILMGIALDPAEFHKQKWIPRDSREDHPQLCNDGSRLLCLKKHFVQCGLEAFDVLAAVQDLLPHLDRSDKNPESVTRIATFGGGPGSTALAVCLFFLHSLPCLATQVDIVTAEERWQPVVAVISLKHIGIHKAELLDAVKHPSMLRPYRVLVFMNSLGDSEEGGGWEAFWNDVYENTAASVLVIVGERNVCWEAMRPRKGSHQWWAAAAPGDETVHLVRKM